MSTDDFGSAGGQAHEAVALTGSVAKLPQH